MTVWVIIVVVFILCVCLRYAIWPDEPTVPAANNHEPTAYSAKSVIDERGDPMLVNSGTIIQLIDSLQIIGSTTNIETLESRIEYCDKIFNRIRAAYQNDEAAYLIALSQACSFMQKGTIGSCLPINMESLITMDEDDMKGFYSQSVLNFFNEYSRKMVKEMRELKTKAAQKRRIDKVGECHSQCRVIINLYGIQDYANKLDGQYDDFILLYDQSTRRLKNNIYVFIAYFVEYSNIKSFYDIRNSLSKFKEELSSYKSYLKSPHFQECLSKTIKEYEKQNDITFSNEFICQLENPETITIDEHSLYRNAATYFKEYWDAVLNSYKRRNAYANRLDYLIENLNRFINDPNISQYKDVINLLEDYKQEYIVQKEKCNNTLTQKTSPAKSPGTPSTTL